MSPRRQRCLLVRAIAQVMVGILVADGLYDDCAGEVDYIGDATCDFENNNAACGYDGGDCCPSTCTPSSYSIIPCTGYTDFCFDPLASDYDPTYENCTGELMGLQDGACDEENNVASCAYDGGDCCPCTCVDLYTRSYCGRETVYDCKDPEAADIIYDCEPTPPDPGRCVPAVQSDWVVEDSAGAAALAAAANCSGGVFRVSWIGHVVLEAPIWVVNGTELEIRADGPGAVADGAGRSRFLTVVDATAYLEGVEVMNGAGRVGGAILAASGAFVALNHTAFVNNSAEYGGAIYASGDSVVSCDDHAMFVGNTASVNGGAIYASANSTVSWTGVTEFTGNYADESGASVFALAATVRSYSDTVFSGNRAIQNAGGVFATTGSVVDFSGVTLFANNSARWGAAIQGQEVSSVSLGGRTDFTNNSASAHGGAVYIQTVSHLTWSGRMLFNQNSAELSGGAIALSDGCACSWEGNTSFVENFSLDENGGAIAVGASSNVSSTGSTIFEKNWAVDGGALYIDSGASISMHGNTEFDQNRASSRGGAIGSSLSDSGSMSATYSVSGKASFVGNSCGSDGGAIALNGALGILFDDAEVHFDRNYASGSGGAVFVSATEVGPVFRSAMFTFNSAQQGGGVFTTGSGTAVTESSMGDRVEHSVTYDGCSFQGNSATATGGAVDSTTGKDEMINVTFTGNTASTGGALRMAGTASMRNCSFEGNSASEDQGPAIFNLGGFSDFRFNDFVGNVVICPAGSFVDFREGDRYESVCTGCPECASGCLVEDEDLATTCTLAYDNTVSSGLNTTVEALEIDPGYWRATNTSAKILACYNENACLGGISGQSGYCEEGYQGPYCSVCSDGYSTTTSYTCRKCSDSQTLLSGAFISIIVVMALVVVIAHLIAKEAESDSNSSRNSDRGGHTGDNINSDESGSVIRKHAKTCLQPVKIVIVVWQILTQFGSVANVTYPGVYGRFLSSIDFLTFDLGMLFSAGCLVEGIDFHDRLLISTLGPILVTALLGVTYGIASVRTRNVGGSLRKVRGKHASALLLLTFLVYSSVSALVFSAFACERLDDGFIYLRADYTIECDSPTHKAFQVYAGVMILVYPVGIPLAYAMVLYANRRVLRDPWERQVDDHVNTIEDLWSPYRPECYMYEVLECTRRVSLTGVIVFIYPNTAAQVAVTLVLAFAFNVVFETLAPYESRSDTWISRIGHVVVFMSMYVALLLKVDVSSEQDESQEVFAGFLVAVHAGLFLAAITEMAITSCSFVGGQRVEHAGPRSWPCNTTGISGVVAAQGELSFDDIDASGSSESE